MRTVFLRVCKARDHIGAVAALPVFGIAFPKNPFCSGKERGGFQGRSAEIHCKVIFPFARRRCNPFGFFFFGRQNKLRIAAQNQAAGKPNPALKRLIAEQAAFRTLRR